MNQAANNSNKFSKGNWLSVGLLLALVLSLPVFATPVSYTYDSLNRLTSVDYGNGQQVISYTYDAAGNILSRTVTDGQGPLITAAPVDTTYINSPTVTMTGAATDAGTGDNGIASVMINSQPATGGTATSSNTANWSINLTLSSGSNVFTVIAIDSSPQANQTTSIINLIYIPFTFDTDGDGLDDLFEQAIGTDSALADTDGDGINDGQELGYDGDGSFYDIFTDTDPLTNDSDGDGVSDGDEVVAGTDPLDNTSYPVTPDGDLNVDGVVDVRDMLIAQRILLGHLSLTQEYLNHGDVAPLLNGVPNPDGLFNLGDMLIIQQKALGFIDF